MYALDGVILKTRITNKDISTKDSLLIDKYLLRYHYVWSGFWLFKNRNNLKTE